MQSNSGREKQSENPRKIKRKKYVRYTWIMEPEIAADDINYTRDMGTNKLREMRQKNVRLCCGEIQKCPGARWNGKK